MLRIVPPKTEIQPNEVHVYVSSGHKVTVQKPFLGLAKSLFTTYAVQVRTGFHFESTYNVQDTRRRKQFRMRIVVNGSISPEPERARVAAQLAMPDADLQRALLELGSQCASLQLGQVCTIDLDEFLVRSAEIDQQFRERLHATGIDVAMAAIEALPLEMPSERDVHELVLESPGDFDLSVHPSDASRVARYGFSLIVTPSTGATKAQYLVADLPLHGDPSVRQTAGSIMRAFLNGRYTFEQHTSEIERIQRELSAHLQAQLPVSYGLELKLLTLRSDCAQRERPETNFSFELSYPINGTQTPLLLRHTGSIRRVDSGQWVRAGAPEDMDSKVRDWIARATQQALQGLGFADILQMDQRAGSGGKSSIEEISSGIEQKVQTDAQAMGHEVRQFLAHVVELPEKNLLSGLDIAVAQSDFGLRDQSYRPSLGFSLHVRLTQPERLRGLTGFSNLVQDRVAPRIRAVIGNILASVLPNEYLRSTLASGGGSPDLRTRLEHELTDSLREEFGLTLVTLLVTNENGRNDPVSSRFAEICDVTRKLSDIRGLAWSQQSRGQSEVRLRLTYRIVGIWQQSTDIFRNKTRLPVNEQLDEIDNCVRGVFDQMFMRQSHESFDARTLAGDFGTALKQELQAKIGSELGVDVLVTDLHPLQSASFEEERNKFQSALESVRRRLEEAREKRLDAISRVETAADLEDLRPIERVIELLEAEEQKILLKQRPDVYLHLGRPSEPPTASPDRTSSNG